MNGQRCEADESCECGDVDPVRFEQVGDVENTETFEQRIGDGNIANDERRRTKLQVTSDVEYVAFVNVPIDLVIIEVVEGDVTSPLAGQINGENQRKKDQSLHWLKPSEKRERVSILFE